MSLHLPKDQQRRLDEACLNRENPPPTLGQRAVVCKSWQFLSGARIKDDQTGIAFRFTNGDWKLDQWHECMEDAEASQWGACQSRAEAAGPDLLDPATRGCLLVVLRKVWHDRNLHVVADNNGGYGPWTYRVLRHITGRGFVVQSAGFSEEDARVLALENAH